MHYVCKAFALSGTTKTPINGNNHFILIIPMLNSRPSACLQAHSLGILQNASSQRTQIIPINVLSWDSCYKPGTTDSWEPELLLISQFLPHGLDIFETFLLKEPVIVFSLSYDLLIKEHLCDWLIQLQLRLKIYGLYYHFIHRTRSYTVHSHLQLKSNTLLRPRNIR